MRILVTGHRGFIGQNMVNALKDEYDIVTYDWGDELPSFAHISQVIHLGAVTNPAETDADKVMTQNYDFTRRLFDLCRNNMTNIQYASCASVYGKGKEFKETSPVDPRTPVAWSKYLSERYLLENNTNSKVQIFRYFDVYGPGETDNLYAMFTKQAEESGIVKVYKDSEKHARDFVHVRDLITVHKKFLNYRDQGVFNLGTGKSRNVLDIATEIAKKYRAKIEKVSMPKSLEHYYQTHTQADTTKLMKTLKQ